MKQRTINEQLAIAVLKRMAGVYFLKMFQYNLTKRLVKKYS